MSQAIYLTIAAAMSLTACFKGPGFMKQSGIASLKSGGSGTISAVVTTKDEAGGETAALKANSNATQEIRVASSSPVAGTVVAFPPGTLAIDTDLKIEEAVTVATSSTAADLGLGDNIGRTGTAVSIQTSIKTDPVQAFTVALSVPQDAGLALADELSTLVVIYKIQKVAEGKVVAGIIPRSEITVDGQSLLFSTKYFGAFQAAFTKVLVTEAKQVEVSSPIQTKQDVQSLPPIAISARSPFVVGRGDKVEIIGTNFRPTMTLALGGAKVSNLKVLSDVRASFTAPAYEGFGLANLTADQDGVAQTVSLFYKNDKNDLPVSTMAEADVCAGQKYYDANGTIKIGTRSCDGPNLSALTAANLKAGVSVAGVTGTLIAAPADCSGNEQVGCVTTAAFKAADWTNLLGVNIKSGVSIAGVAGTYSPATVPDCNADGQINCKAVAAFKAIDMSKIIPGNIKINVTIAAVAGTVVPTAANCTSDGATNCVVTSSFAAASTSGLASKVISTQTVAGVTGNVLIPPAGKVESGFSYGVGGNGSTGTLALPGIAYVNAGVNFGAGGNALTGILTLPAVSKVRTTNGVFGVGGNGSTPTLADCSTDGEEACVSNASFKAADMSVATPSHIASGSTIAGVGGTFSGGFSNCSADGATGCIAVAAFPAANLALFADSDIKVSKTIAGIPGALSTCTTPGVNNCYLPAYAASTQPLKTVNYDSLSANAANFRSSYSLLGVPGTLADCSTDGATGCVAVTGFVAAAAGSTHLHAQNIKSGVTIGGVTGDYPSATYPLPNAGSGGALVLDAATFDVRMKSSSDFEWWNKDGTRYVQAGDTDITAGNFSSNVTVFGTTGSIPGCSSNGQQNCITNATHKAVNVSTLSGWDIRDNVNIAGVVGVLAAYKNMADSATFNRTTGPDATGVIDIYDTIDDFNVNGAFPSGTPPGWVSGVGANWVRDSASDTATGVGSCDGGEDCVYKDNVTKLYWARDTQTAAYWEAAISSCSGLTYGTYSDWRLPTQKELLQAYIDGIWTVKGTTFLTLSNVPYWTATTASTTTTSAHMITLSTGSGALDVKATYTHRFLCVRP